MKEKVVYPIIFILFFSLSANRIFAATSTYNFVGITSPSSGHWAGDRAGSPANPNDGSLAQASQANYDNIESENAAYFTTSKSSTDAEYDSQVFRFYISEAESKVSKLTFLWNGHSDETRSGYDLSLLYWNYNTSAWTTCQTDSDGSTADINLTCNTTSPSPLIDTDKEIALWARFKNYESGACPTIYSFDKNGNEVLEEETILGLINKRMEKYHYEDLEYAYPKDNQLKITIKEERPEITFLNDVKLIVVDTRAEQVLMAPDGSPQTINNLQPVASCKSKRGEDCLAQIINQDSKPEKTFPVDNGGGINFKENWRQTAWTTQDPKLLDFSKKENLRDWIEIELPPFPDYADTAKLVVSASETGILSFGEVDWVTTSKENVEFFFNLSDNTPFGDHWKKQLYRVSSPKIQIQDEKGQWINYPDASFDENIFSTYDTLVFPLDLSLIKNNKIRIESMSYTYIYDYVGVDYTNLEYQAQTMPVSYASHKNENILESISQLDGNRFVLPPYEQMELAFQLPQEDPSLSRSYHMQIAGYYQPERSVKKVGSSFWGGIKGQIKKEGLLNFVKKTVFEIYDMIMTSTNFDYANRRLLNKYFKALEGKNINPDKTFKFFPTSSNSLYTDYIQVVVNYSDMTVTGVSLNASSSINLIENSTTSVLSTATATDPDGYADIVSASGVIYRSGVSGAESCSANNNNCYQASSCATSSCSGNSCRVTCSYNVWFHADPTDVISTWSSEKWNSWIKVIGNYASSSATNSTETVEVNTLRALNVTSNISYGIVDAGSDTGSTNPTTTVMNTGNSAIDLEVSGSDLCTNYPTCSGNKIIVSNQEYATGSFTYGAGNDLSSATSSLNLNLTKPTSQPSTSTDNVYWGLGVPQETAVGTYTGQNTFTATGQL